MTMQIWTVVVAAGRSTRFGGPKLLQPLGTADERVIDHSVRTAVAVSDGVVLVTDTAEIAAGQPVDTVVPGGDTRSASVRAGLAAVPDDATVVLVHDAARPAASEALFGRVIGAMSDSEVDGVVPALAVADTIKHLDASGLVRATLDRAGLVAVQTPQGFRRSTLIAAHSLGGEATDDAALIEQHGGTVISVVGEPENFKITTPLDLVLMRATLAADTSEIAP